MGVVECFGRAMDKPPWLLRLEQGCCIEAYATIQFYTVNGTTEQGFVATLS